MKLARTTAVLMVGLSVSVPAARGESPAAFDRRCIPPDGVAPPSNTLGILGRRALSAGCIAGLGPTRDIHHGLLAGQAPTDATPVLLKAREALGGEKKLTSIKTIVASGQTRQVRGENLIPIVFEINIELPAKYSRRDETPAVESGYTTSGFSSDDLIQLPPPTAPTMPPMAARPGGPPPRTPEQIAAQQDAQRKNRVATLKQDYARLMLGFFAASTDVFPLTFQRFGIAESPQGKADVITVLGPNNFTANLLINQVTHLPVMLSWVPAAPPARGGATPAAPPEQRLYFADYRDAGGVMWPHRIRRAVGADTIEETTFDRFRLNAKIDPKKFEVVK